MSTAQLTAAGACMQAQEHEYDIIGHPQLNFSFVVVFPFHPYTDGRRGGQVSAQHLQLEQTRFQQLIGSPALSCVPERSWAQAVMLCMRRGCVLMAQL